MLIVEDETLLRWSAVAAAQDAGFCAVEAGSAIEAIAILENRNDIRIVFTDIQMPGSMDGLKLSAFVRKRWPPVRIIVTSGKRLVEITELPDGSMFFAKPYQLDVVTTAMRELAVM